MSEALTFQFEPGYRGASHIWCAGCGSLMELEDSTLGSVKYYTTLDGLGRARNGDDVPTSVHQPTCPKCGHLRITEAKLDNDLLRLADEPKLSLADKGTITVWEPCPRYRTKKGTWCEVRVNKEESKRQLAAFNKLAAKEKPMYLEEMMDVCDKLHLEILNWAALNLFLQFGNIRVSMGVIRAMKQRMLSVVNGKATEYIETFRATKVQRAVHKHGKLSEGKSRIATVGPVALLIRHSAAWRENKTGWRVSRHTLNMAKSMFDDHGCLVNSKWDMRPRVYKEDGTEKKPWTSLDHWLFALEAAFKSDGIRFIVDTLKKQRNGKDKDIMFKLKNKKGPWSMARANVGDHGYIRQETRASMGWPRCWEWLWPDGMTKCIDGSKSSIYYKDPNIRTSLFFDPAKDEWVKEEQETRHVEYKDSMGDPDEDEDWVARSVEGTLPDEVVEPEIGEEENN